MPHPAVVAGCVVGGLAAAIAFEVAIFKPWRDRYGQEVLQEAEADWDRFRMELRDNMERFMGRHRDEEIERSLQEIEEFELAHRQSEETARDRQSQLGREMGAAQEGGDEHGLRRRRAYVEDDGQGETAPTSHQGKGKDRATSTSDLLDFAAAPHHALGDETPSTLPNSPTWPVPGPEEDDSLSATSAVMVNNDAASSSSWSSSPSLPPALHPKPYEYRPENLSQSQLNSGGHEDWMSSSSLSMLSQEAVSAPQSNSDSDTDEEEEEEQLHSSRGLASPPPRLAPLSPPLSDLHSAGWSDLEHDSIRAPSEWQDDSDFGDGSSNASDDHETDDIIGGSGSAVDSGLLIESLDPTRQHRSGLDREHL